MTAVTSPRPRIPVATYRLQFNAQFTFADARRIVAYLHRLGITDCYASSYLRAVPGSGHGYDVADPTRLNPEIGSDDDYRAWVDALRERGMGHVLDLVPNHMGIARSANPWWLDVLENGQCSRYARFFDIEWSPVKDELAGKVLIPILGDQYGEALERQELTLGYGDGAFVVRYHEESLPVAPDTYPLVLQPALDRWIDSGTSPAGEDVEELRSIITAATHLPARSSRDEDAMRMRAREKEVVKRRLAALVGRVSALQHALDHTLASFNGTPGQPRSFDRLDGLLNQQSYRVAHWRVASEEINYRRFFDVNQLAAVRMEDPEVFEEVHRFAFELIARRAATGLRVDHVDGLFAPADYLRRLQSRAAAALGADPAEQRPVYLVVEKILGADEQLPAEWPVHGTTGYEFAAVVNNLFVDRRNERAFDDLYARFIRQPRSRPSFDDLAYASKKLIVHATMSGDINWLGHQLNRFSERNRHFRDFTLYSLISALKELIACFPVYRTYITAEEPVSERDRRYIAQAVRCARRRATESPALVFDFIQRVLLKQTAVSTPEECEERGRFIGKFQQITSPVAAKGIEDTALYIYNRLISLNDVGAEPTRFGLDPADVHAWMAGRQRQWPAALSATSTHDTKRGEDVRVRIDVLSERPAEWKAAVTKWRALNRRFKVEVNDLVTPTPNDEYFLYQTLLGAWPATADGDAHFPDRLKDYLRKALREAKVNTSWLSPNDDYENAVFRFVDAILGHRLFLQAFRPFQARVAELGTYNSLAQLLIKITAPGVPDFYQGTEAWDLNLVDPDNRRPVDYDGRQRTLASVENADPSALLEARRDGRVKAYVMTNALRARAALRGTFEHGSYVPLRTSGARGEHVFAFARRWQGRTAVTCVPRLVAGLLGDRAVPPVGDAVWEDTRIDLHDDGDANAPWPASLRDAFTGETVEPVEQAGGRRVDVARVLARFPVALLMPAD